jgi:hypothetical protein
LLAQKPTHYNYIFLFSIFTKKSFSVKV